MNLNHEERRNKQECLKLVDIQVNHLYAVYVANPKTMKIIRSVIRSLGVVILFLCCTSPAGTAANLRRELSQVPKAELPACAANIVSGAAPKARHEIAIKVTRTGIQLNPAAAGVLVAEIAKNNPDVAATAAAAGAEMLPDRAGELAKAAAQAAPSKASLIVKSVCRAVPSQYKAVAVAVAQAVPSASRDILEAVAAALPELKSGIVAELTTNTGKSLSVAGVLSSVRSTEHESVSTGLTAQGGTPTTSTPVQPARGPTVAPPYVPYSSSGPNVTPTTSGTVPRGGRTYASP